MELAGRRLLTCMDEQKKARRIGSLGFMVFLFCIVAVLISITLLKLSIRRSSGLGPANICISNLRQIEAAANQFALENHLTNGAHINFPNDLTPYIKLDANEKIRSCLSGGIYSMIKVGDKPTCSLGTTMTPAHVLP